MSISSLLKDLADSIRSKTHRQDLMQIKEMAAEVEKIPSLSPTALCIFEGSPSAGTADCVLPDGRYIDIGHRAFKNSPIISSLITPLTLNLIDVWAFHGCENLKKVDMSKSVGLTMICGGAFGDCANLEEITLPPHLEVIEYEAFENCKKLKKITIPKMVVELGFGLLNGSSVSEIYVKSVTPPGLEHGRIHGTWLGTFDGIPANAVIYVPRSSLNAYKTANQWSSLASRIQPDPNS